MKPYSITFTSEEETFEIYTPQFVYAEYKKQPVGTLMLDILNVDIDKLTSIVQKYDSVPPRPNEVPFVRDRLGRPQILGVPSGCQEVYKEITDSFPFMQIYSAGEWFEIKTELLCGTLGATVCRLQELIGITESQPKYLNYQFMKRYLREGAMGVLTSFHFEIEDSDPDITLEDDYYFSRTSIKHSLEQEYCRFISGNHTEQLHYIYNSITPRLGGSMVASFLELIRRGKVVRRCKLCGKYFIPRNRSDTLYCDMPSPEDPGMTCKEYGTRRLWYEKQKDDELSTFSRKIASAKGMLAKRNPDIPEYSASYEYFKAERLKWKKEVEGGTKTKEEYREWLRQMQNQKVIKEAIKSSDSE